jgi:hypothetical protein|tara:strand:- start:9315 stop:9524 length:210 start_codon:yes stop_codon:yes gene_type:complete
MKLIKDLRVLNAISKRYSLDFCNIFKYYIGDAYKDSKDNYLPKVFNYKSKAYKLKYFDGCFNPFLIEIL